jgi:hypothetical protein
MSTLYVENVVYDPQNPTPNKSLDRCGKLNSDDTLLVAVLLRIRAVVVVVCAGVGECISGFVEEVSVLLIVDVESVLPITGTCDNMKEWLVVGITGVPMTQPRIKLPLTLIKAVCQPR